MHMAAPSLGFTRHSSYNIVATWGISVCPAPAALQSDTPAAQNTQFPERRHLPLAGADIGDGDRPVLE